MGFGWQEIDKNLDLGYIRVAGLHCGCKPAYSGSTQLSPPHHDTRMYVFTYLFIGVSSMMHHPAQHYSITTLALQYHYTGTTVLLQWHYSATTLALQCVVCEH